MLDVSLAEREPVTRPLLRPHRTHRTRPPHRTRREGEGRGGGGVYRTPASHIDTPPFRIYLRARRGPRWATPHPKGTPAALNRNSTPRRRLLPPVLPRDVERPPRRRGGRHRLFREVLAAVVLDAWAVIPGVTGLLREGARRSYRRRRRRRSSRAAPSGSAFQVGTAPNAGTGRGADVHEPDIVRHSVRIVGGCNHPAVGRSERRLWARLARLTCSRTDIMCSTPVAGARFVVVVRHIHRCRHAANEEQSSVSDRILLSAEPHG